MTISQVRNKREGSGPERVQVLWRIEIQRTSGKGQGGGVFPQKDRLGTAIPPQGQQVVDEAPGQHGRDTEGAPIGAGGRTLWICDREGEEASEQVRIHSWLIHSQEERRLRCRWQGGDPSPDGAGHPLPGIGVVHKSHS